MSTKNMVVYEELNNVKNYEDVNGRRNIMTTKIFMIMKVNLTGLTMSE